MALYDIVEKAPSHIETAIGKAASGLFGKGIEGAAGAEFIDLLILKVGEIDAPLCNEVAASSIFMDRGAGVPLRPKQILLLAVGPEANQGVPSPLLRARLQPVESILDFLGAT
jgi:hypothetical protein